MPLEAARNTQKVYIIHHPDDPTLLGYTNAKRALRQLLRLGSEDNYSWMHDKRSMGFGPIISDDINTAANQLRAVGNWIQCGKHRCTCIAMNVGLLSESEQESEHS